MTIDSTESALSATTSCGAPTAAVALFRSLGDPARLAILRRLAEGEARVTDLVSCVGLAQSTVSAHLACLCAQHNDNRLAAGGSQQLGRGVDEKLAVQRNEGFRGAEPATGPRS